MKKELEREIQILPRGYYFSNHSVQTSTLFEAFGHLYLFSWVSGAGAHSEQSIIQLGAVISGERAVKHRTESLLLRKIYSRVESVPIMGYIQYFICSGIVLADYCI